jgi:FeS assembly SUF system regulator
MIRISKLADYGTVIMAYLAHRSSESHNAKEIASATHIALPTVSKLLKQLSHEHLVESSRGAKGGYSLKIPAAKLTLAMIVNALDGGVALTECSHSKGMCAVESTCAIRRSFRNVSSVISDVLSKVTLAEML